MSDIERQATEGKKEMVRTQAKEKSQCPQHFSQGAHDFSHWGEWRL